MIKIGEKKIYKNFKVRKPLEIEAGETLNVATHGNVFHADEIVAIALLRIYYKGYNMKVIRSSCINDIKSSNFAINVGRQNKITDSQVKFDCTKEDTVYIQDLNSTNGTFHNGARLGTNEILPIYAEDEIRIGKCVFVYQ